MVGQKKNGMNLKIDVNELVIKNIHNYLKKKKIDYKDFIAELYKLVPKEKVDYFFAEKQGVDADLIIGISKVLKENLDYFCIPHIEDETLSIEQEKLVELAKLCNQNFDVKSVDVNEKLYELGNYAYDNELISFSKLQYYLNCSVSEIMEL
ncbi:MAG: hypothetical protein IIU99_08260 [Treponema sp.]|nr:hypothetical protein [Treponema sp.]